MVLNVYQIVNCGKYKFNVSRITILENVSTVECSAKTNKALSFNVYTYFNLRRRFYKMSFSYDERL